MRFNDPEHLETWKKFGRWPAIHDQLFQLIASCAEGISFCDLGCCFGLLGERVRQALRVPVCGIEADQKVIMAGWKAGITFPVLQLKVSRATTGAAITWLEVHKVTALIARRILPEIWADDIPAGRTFAEKLRKVGVNEIFLQGRNVSTQTVNALGGLDEELALLAGSYRLIERNGQCAYLKAI